MPMVSVLLGEEEVDAYLKEHGLEEGFVPLEAALLQLHGTQDGKPAIMLIAEVDGKKRVIKTSVHILGMIMGAVQGTLIRLANEAEQQN